MAKPTNFDVDIEEDFTPSEFSQLESSGEELQTKHNITEETVVTTMQLPVTDHEGKPTGEFKTVNFKQTKKLAIASGSHKIINPDLVMHRMSHHISGAVETEDIEHHEQHNHISHKRCEELKAAIYASIAKQPVEYRAELAEIQNSLLALNVIKENDDLKRKDQTKMTAQKQDVSQNQDTEASL